MATRNPMQTELELARAAQKRGAYRGETDGVRAEVDGHYRLRRLQLDPEQLGIDAPTARRLEDAIAESVRAAVEKARRRAERRLQKVFEARQVEAPAREED